MTVLQRSETERRAAILVVEDDPILRGSLAELLRTRGYVAHDAAGVAGALTLLQREPVQLVISDINMPQADGFELLRVLRERHPEIVAVLITGYGTIESAVDAIKLGAFDYLTKPIQDDDLYMVVERALQQQSLLAENRALRDRLGEQLAASAVVGQDYKMAKILDLVETVADSRITVLLTGESGTGKSLIAREVHRLSPRRAGPFVEVSCGAIPESLLESELFGHVQGAFTGAVADKIGRFKAADGGTLFLDEIAAASPALQVKLLRVLQERQFEPVGSHITESVDVRVVLATNVDLQAEVRAGRFREDLYYRVNVVNIVLPPLRERLGDIPLLARRFIERFRGETRRTVTGLASDVLHALQAYHWPGNVRELENVIERAVVFCRGGEIHVDDLPPALQQAAHAEVSFPPAANLSLHDAMIEPEKRIIESALRAHHGSRCDTAAALGINRTTLYKKMKKYGLDTGVLSGR